MNQLFFGFEDQPPPTSILKPILFEKFANQIRRVGISVDWGVEPILEDHWLIHKAFLNLSLSAGEAQWLDPSAWVVNQ
jgi:hypothetical protein